MKIKLVTQEQLENVKDANSLKIAKLEKELQNYKSTMANINVNQEVKQSVSGYGSVSLPKNTANGQVSVSVKGLTATNLVKNGDFSNGTTSWKKIRYDMPFEEENNIASFTALNQYGNIFQKLQNVDIGDKLYTIADIKSDNTKISLQLNHLSGYYFGSKLYEKVGQFETLSTVGVVPADTNFDFIRVIIQDLNSVDWQPVYVKNVMVVNLTQTFGAGNEPTKEECDEIFANWFDGTKSTISASRLKSVDKDGIQESTSYLPNVGELRSLPNGVADEIDLEQGRMTKRVSDTMEELAEPITTPIEVNGTLLSYPSGTVYVEKVLPVAGIYTDEITIAHTDFPISNLDKISKIDFATGVETQLDVSKAVVATDKLSFTHTDLTSGDIVFFEYFYANESTQGELELEYYDSRHVLKDSVTGKFYKIIPTVANGELTNGLLEV